MADDDFPEHVRDAPEFIRQMVAGAQAASARREKAKLERESRNSPLPVYRDGKVCGFVKLPTDHHAKKHWDARVDDEPYFEALYLLHDGQFLVLSSLSLSSWRNGDGDPSNPPSDYATLVTPGEAVDWCVKHLVDVPDELLAAMGGVQFRLAPDGAAVAPEQPTDDVADAIRAEAARAELAAASGAFGGDESAYIAAKNCRWGDIDTHDKLKGVIRRNAIRSKPKGQRLLVHAGDWARYVAQRERAAQNLMDDPAVAALLDEKAERQATIRARKAEKGAAE